MRLAASRSWGPRPGYSSEFSSQDAAPGPEVPHGSGSGAEDKGGFHSQQPLLLWNP